MWLLPQKLDREEVSSYFQTFEQLDYNVVLVQVLNDVPSVNVYGYYSHTDNSTFGDGVLIAFDVNNYP